MVIGKIFSAGDLGNFARAQQFSSFPSSNITGILQRVTYPILCEIQDDDERLSKVYRKFLKLSAFIVFPLMLGLSRVSIPLIYITVGEKWDFCAELLQIICFSMMWYPIHAINLNLLRVTGRSDLLLRLEVIKKILGVIILCITIPYGLKAMCLGMIVGSVISLVINTYYTGKLIAVGFIIQIRDFAPILLMSVIMFIVVVVFQFFVDNVFFQLFGGIIIGGVFYIVGTWVLHFSELQELVSLFGKRK